MHVTSAVPLFASWQILQLMLVFLLFAEADLQICHCLQKCNVTASTVMCQRRLKKAPYQVCNMRRLSAHESPQLLLQIPPVQLVCQAFLADGNMHIMHNQNAGSILTSVVCLKAAAFLFLSWSCFSTSVLKSQFFLSIVWSRDNTPFAFKLLSLGLSAKNPSRKTPLGLTESNSSGVMIS